MITDRRTEFEATLTRTAEARGQEAGAAIQRASLLRDAIYRFSRNRAAVVARKIKVSTLKLYGKLATRCNTCTSGRC